MRRYLLLDEIGRGANGSVRIARDRRQCRYVAAKVPHVALPGRASTPARVDHPHVLVPTAWTEDGETLLVMDLVRGGSLLDLCAEVGRLPESFVVVVLAQVLQALVAAHAVGVVHRDVKPANLLLEATGSGRPHVRLADFGDAETIGTRGYVAPERESGARPHPSQDVYAAGVLARRLLDVPGPLTTLASSMARRDPGLRPTAASALARLRSLPVPRGGPWPHVTDRVQVRLASSTRRRLAVGLPS